MVRMVVQGGIDAIEQSGDDDRITCVLIMMKDIVCTSELEANRRWKGHNKTLEARIESASNEADNIVTIRCFKRCSFAESVMSTKEARDTGQ